MLNFSLDLPPLHLSSPRTKAQTLQCFCYVSLGWRYTTQNQQLCVTTYKMNKKRMLLLPSGLTPFTDKTYII